MIQINKLIYRLAEIKSIIEDMNMKELEVLLNVASVTGIDLSQYTIDRTINKLMEYSARANGDFERADAILNREYKQ